MNYYTEKSHVHIRKFPKAILEPGPQCLGPMLPTQESEEGPGLGLKKLPRGPSNEVCKVYIYNPMEKLPEF